MNNDIGILAINDYGCLDKKLTDHRHPHLFSSPVWIDVLRRQYGFDFYKVQASSQNDFLIVARVQQFGVSKITGLPFCDYMIPSATNARTLNKLIAKLKNHFPEQLIELKIVLPDAIKPDELNYQSVTHAAYRHVVNTGVSLVKIENNMDNSFMRGVRQAKSNDLAISLQKDEEALSTFYELYCKQRAQKFEKLPQPFSFFEKIHSNFLKNDRGFILQATKDSTVIASMMILAHHKALYYKFGCSVQKYLNLRPNNLLFYRLFKYAHENNFDTVGLGLSGVSEDYAGLVRFKEYMGGISSNIYSLRISPPDYDESAEKQLHAFTSSLTKTIVDQQPDKKTADAFSEKLYPLFA